VYYWQKTHAKMPKGRVFRSLETRDEAVAIGYAGALQTLIDRGDFSVVARWVAGEIHIGDLARQVREGNWQGLMRLHSEGLGLGAEVEDFLARVRALKSARTHEVKESALRIAVEHFGAERRLHTVTKAEAEAYLQAKRETAKGSPWAPNSQRSHRAILAEMWDWAREREAEAAKVANAAPTLAGNPWRGAKIPKRGPARFSFFTVEQARTLLAHGDTAGTHKAALFASALYAGLRAGELAHLRTDADVDLARWYFHIQAHAGDYAWTPKTSNSYRKVLIVPALRPYLKAHRKTFAGERYFFKAEGRDSPPSISTLDLWTKEAFEAAGFKYGRTGEALTLHSCRHSFATWLIAAGVPVTTVAKLLGDTLETVLAVYAHHLPEMETAAYELLQKFAGGKA
jgi:integrase